MRELTGILILLGAVSIESVAQLCLKLAAAARGGPGAAPGPGRRTWLALGAGAYAIEILLYTGALCLLDLSVAFPVGSLSFVGVALLSRVVLGEAVGPVRWAGVGCILAGAICVAL